MRMKRRLLITAKGRELNRFVNMIHLSGTECKGQYCRGEVFRGDILRRDMKKLEAIAKECGVELKAAESDSLFARIFRYRRRTGLMAGAAAAAAAVLLMSQMLTTIDIQGNSAVSDEIIIAALDQLGVKEGSFLPCTDLRSCEKQLPFLIDEVAWAGIRRTGNSIVVQIREAEPEPDMLRTRIPCNLIADRDAEITSVHVRSGELIHIVGDYVPKGTLLVSAVTESDFGHTYVYHAMGEIRGKYTESVSFSAPFRCEETSPTGRTDTHRRLELFSLRIPLFLGRNRYGSSTETVSEKKLRLFGRELPIGIERRDIAETCLTEKEYSEEELKDKLMERVYLYEKNFLSDDTVILGRDIRTENSGGVLTLTVNYELEGVISQPREVFIK
ncbi:sporulation protein YqfD [uncultured Ruminococcus sp.]|uniref:sporulation protein YqfD n=1 Tax=uncultured Ruminococcus sp. TaxID=165186 RepID=UPI00262F0D9A|nr:sporulation protein YqfD [uncultured Ruminococcus sp.]